MVSAGLGGDPAGELLVIVSSGPDLAEEVGRVDIAVVFEEIEVTAAAVHQVWVEFAAEFGAGLGENAWEVGDVVERIAEGGESVSGEGFGAFLAVLDRVEIIAADGGDEQGRGGRRVLFVAEVLDEVEKLAGLVADLFEQLEVTTGEPRVVIALAILVARGAAVEEVEKLFVPSHGAR